ncbi:MAG: hypothetical protein OXR68_05455 [Alphaproteobacteria bacterium]|nr:hypothetical protein [Alphaproteobacteria bacterium]MDD9920050.1 hypothetical protein [Alphaproteobacteria bacterium]
MFELLKSATQPTIGSRFRDICIVGLNRVELLVAGSEEPVLGDGWQDVTDEQTRRRMALLFFAPRELDGQPVSPYQLLAEEPDDEEVVHATQQALGNIPLVDLCRISPAEPNTVNFLVAADTIFHWDLNDNYVLPTTKFTWVKDIQRIMRSYPKATKATIYTNWDADKVGDLEIPTKPLRSFPLDLDTWVNIPTFQEKNGTYVLIAAVGLIAATWALLHYQSQQMKSFSEEIRITQQRIPREGKFVELSRFMVEQEKFMQYRDLYPWLIRDAANAIQISNMKIESLEVVSPTPLEPTDVMIATIEAERGIYKGWLQEEPIAKDVLISSRTMSAVRKPPGNLFKLEGLMNLKPLMRAYKSAAKDLKIKQDALTQPSAATAEVGDVPPTESNVEDSEQ